MQTIRQQIKLLKDQVRHILENYPKTRNSDIALTIELWKEFYPQNIRVIVKTNDLLVRLEDLYHLPNQDNVKRIRAKIQNEEKEYPPTDWKIAENRGWLEEEWKKALGYFTTPKGQTKLF